MKHKFYCIVNISNEKIIKVSPNRLSATVFLANYIRHEHQEHFDMWCQLRGLTGNMDDWNLYCKDVIALEPQKYSIEIVRLSSIEIANGLTIALNATVKED